MTHVIAIFPDKDFPFRGISLLLTSFLELRIYHINFRGMIISNIISGNYSIIMDPH